MNVDIGSLGIGYHEVIEEMISGMKSVELYESPAADVIIESHKLFEQLVYPKSFLVQKKRLEQECEDIIYNGNWFSKRCNELKLKLKEMQKRLTGNITVECSQIGIHIVSFKSDFSLYDANKRSLEL